MSPKELVFTSRGHAEVVSLSLRELGPTDVRVRARYTLVSPGTELSYLQGTNQKLDGYPYRPGQSMIGEIEAIGSDVTDVMPGDSVFCFGGHASHAIRQEGAVFPYEGLVDDYQPVFANLVGQAVTAVAPLDQIKGVRAGITGLGLFGQLIARVMLAEGANSVLASSTSRFRRQHATVGMIAMSTIAGCDADVTVEATGHQRRIVEACEATRPGGTVVLFGHPRHDVTLDVYSLLQRRGLTLIGTQLGVRSLLAVRPEWATTDSVLSWAFTRLGDGSVDCRSLVTDVLRPSALPKFYRLLLSRKRSFLGVVVNWT